MYVNACVCVNVFKHINTYTYATRTHTYTQPGSFLTWFPSKCTDVVHMLLLYLLENVQILIFDLVPQSCQLGIFRPLAINTVNLPATHASDTAIALSPD